MAHVATVTIDNTKVTADQTDFPVYIDLSDMPAGFWSTVADGGGDIRCYKSDGTTELPREVVSCATATDTGELHVKYTGTLSSTADTEIQIHADGTSSDYAIDATYGAENVWKSAYKAVWHLNEASGTRLDSTTNDNDLTDGSSVGTSTTSKIGVASAEFLTSSSDYLRIASASQTGLNLTNNFSLSLWAYYTTDSANAVMFIRDSADTTDTYNWRVLQTASHTNVRHGVTGYVESTGASSTGSWYKLDFTKDSTSGGEMFYQGTSVDTDAITANSSGGTKDVVLGKRQYTGSPIYYDGLMDEVRVYDGVYATGWVATEYNNQNSASTFYTATAAETASYIKTRNTVAQANIQTVNTVS